MLMIFVCIAHYELAVEIFLLIILVGVELLMFWSDCSHLATASLALCSPCVRSLSSFRYSQFIRLRFQFIVFHFWWSFTTNWISNCHGLYHSGDLPPSLKSLSRYFKTDSNALGAYLQSSSPSENSSHRSTYFLPSDPKAMQLWPQTAFELEMPGFHIDFDSASSALKPWYFLVALLSIFCSHR